MPQAPREVDHTLPTVERVEHHRKAAKELLRATRAGQPGALAEPDVFGERLGHELGVDRTCVDLLIERGSDLDGPLGLAAGAGRVDSLEHFLAGRGGLIAAAYRDRPNPADVGVDVDRPNDFNGDNAIGWGQYVVEQERPGDPRVTAVRDLRSLGSRPLVWGESQPAR